VEPEATTSDVAVWRIRVACWISKTISTHSHTHTHRDKVTMFSTATMIRESGSVIRSTSIVCLLNIYRQSITIVITYYSLFTANFPTCFDHSTTFSEHSKVDNTKVITICMVIILSEQYRLSLPTATPMPVGAGSWVTTVYTTCEPTKKCLLPPLPGKSSWTVLKIQVFYDITRCRLVKVYRWFGEAWCLHLHGSLLGLP
jgi:hypothetical protein